MAPTPKIACIPTDLAQGDATATPLDAAIAVRCIRSADDSWFSVAYDRLWAEFGEKGEMEAREVIASRLTWNPAEPRGDYRYLYEMLVLERGDELIAVRDHTAIARAAPDRTDVWVHLSHVVVEPPWRGQGIAAWLRAFPIQTARECAAALHGEAPRITLVAEMEAPSITDTATGRRLVSYGRAGFRKIDLEPASYAQPDFRDAAAIDASDVAPVPLDLVVRRVGRESEPRISGAEARAIVRALYEMFAFHIGHEHMAPLWKLHEALPEPDAEIELVSLER